MPRSDMLEVLWCAYADSTVVPTSCIPCLLTDSQLPSDAALPKISHSFKALARCLVLRLEADRLCRISREVQWRVWNNKKAVEDEKEKASTQTTYIGISAFIPSWTPAMFSRPAAGGCKSCCEMQLDALPAPEGRQRLADSAERECGRLQRALPSRPEHVTF